MKNAIAPTPVAPARSKRTKKAAAALTIAIAAAGVLAACQTSADIVSANLSREADEFEVQRRIVGINGITDEALFLVEGRCSITRDGDLVVVCKHNDDDYRKHYVGLSDNVTWVSTQLEGIDVSEYHTKIILKPESILPDFDLNLS